MFCKSLIILPLIILGFARADAQYKSFILSVKGDTLNVVDKKGLKQGKWVVHVDPLRGEPGYDEEGEFVDDKREGIWRKYNLQSDLLSIETYRFGGKDGTSQYFDRLGDLVREENWRGYNPNAPYDTIPVYGTGSNEIISFKIVRSEQYSVKNGYWNYYDPSTGRIIKTEEYDRGRLLNAPKNTETAKETPKDTKPKEVLEWEKKNSGKKNVRLRDGQTN